jgi:ADP-ribosylglycohydrolase
MALFTAEGCIRAQNRWSDRGICNPVYVVRGAYLRWLHTQGEPIESIQRLNDMETNPVSGWLVHQEFLNAHRAPGNTCLSGLRSGNDWPHNDSKGCGGVMRMAPAGLMAADPWKAGCEFAALTHGHPTGQLASGAMAVIVSVLAEGGTLDAALDVVESRLRGEGQAGEETLRALTSARGRAREDTAPGETPSAESVELLGGGWIAEEALAIAVYCALVATDFASGVLLAVNHGGDSDSTGAIAGNLLGTMLGDAAIPPHWLDELEGRDVITEVAEDLAGVIGIGPAQARSREYGRYPTW